MTSSSELAFTCPHLDHIKAPRADQIVHREECTQCFDNQDGPNGVDVCLTCFNGACNDPSDKSHQHSSMHFIKTSHPLIMNIKRTPKQRPDDQPPKKLTKLEIVADEPEHDKYDFHTKVECRTCNIDIGTDTGNLPTIIPAILSAQTLARQSDIQAFSFDLVPCEHVLTIQQDPHSSSAPEISLRLSQCTKCDLQANLWLCLTCGNVACGRKQFGGEGLPGNGHALEHYTSTKHPVAVKLGSITAEGKADIFCYTDDEEIVDPELQTHLKHWGIDIKEVVQTEKSLAEMQLDLQYKYSFNMSTSTGEPLEPVFGEGLTGLQNLGNSCYMASVVQALFSIPEWEKRYLVAFEQHPHECNVPYEDQGKGACLECQMAKVANGLISGRYSIKETTVHPDGGAEVSQPGIRPRMLKTLIGAGHAEFAGLKQQDAHEFLIWLLSRIQRQGKPSGCVEQSLLEMEKNVKKEMKKDVMEELGNSTRDGGDGDGCEEWGGYVDPTKCFRFGMQQRIQCLGCGGVKYSMTEQDNIHLTVPDRLNSTEEDIGPEYEDVDFEDCIKTLTAKCEIERTCSQCQHNKATLRNSFITLPDVLIVTATRFVPKNWVPTKIVPKKPFSLDEFLVPRGLQEGENPLPETSESTSSLADPVPSLPPLNETAFLQLQEMGFPANRAEKALRATGNADADVAMQWLFEHMDDADIDAPYESPKAGMEISVDAEKKMNLMGMGFEERMVEKALRQTGGDMERAVDWLFSHPDEPLDDSVPATGTIDTFDTNVNATPVTSSSKVAGYNTKPAQYRLQSVVMHKGSSVHAGHYVAFIRKEIPGVGEDWVLFNDEKVVRGGDWNEVFKTGYVYFFRRV